MDSWTILAEIWVSNFDAISQIWGPELIQICLHRRSRLQHSFWAAFASNLSEFGIAIFVHVVLWAWAFHYNFVLRVEVASKLVHSFVKPLHTCCKVPYTTA